MKNLREIVKEKILILDGAMGTEIQKYNLTEEDFRGERFRDLPGMNERQQRHAQHYSS